SLYRQARDLDGAEQIGEPLNAIRENRPLLGDPDPVIPMKQQLGELLRTELNARGESYAEQWSEGRATLTTSDEWVRLEPSQQEAVLARNRLEPVRERSISSDHDLLAALEKRSLAQWDDMIEALPSR